MQTTILQPLFCAIFQVSPEVATPNIKGLFSIVIKYYSDIKISNTSISNNIIPNNIIGRRNFRLKQSLFYTTKRPGENFYFSPGFFFPRPYPGSTGNQGGRQGIPALDFLRAGHFFRTRDQGTILQYMPDSFILIGRKFILIGILVVHHIP